MFPVGGLQHLDSGAEALVLSSVGVPYSSMKTIWRGATNRGTPRDQGLPGKMAVGPEHAGVTGRT